MFQQVVTYHSSFRARRVKTSGMIDLWIRAKHFNGYFANETSAKFVPRLLNGQERENRFRLYKIEESSSDPALMANIITGDKRWVYGYDPDMKCRLPNGKQVTSLDRRRYVRQSRTLRS